MIDASDAKGEVEVIDERWCEDVAMSDGGGQRLVSTGAAARALAIDRTTLGRWAAAGYVEPASRTVGGHARWDVEQLRQQIDDLRAADPSA